MPRRTLASLGTLVREKRGTRKLREVAKEIGIGPATLMRVENGRTPDISTFAKICRWLEVTPDTFLGFESRGSALKPTGAKAPSTLVVSAHLKADQTPNLATVRALAQMILVAARRQPKVEGVPEDGDA